MGRMTDEPLSRVHVVFTDAFLGCHELWGRAIPGAVASLPVKYRRMLGLRRSPLPVIAATRLVLRLVEAVLGPSSSSEDAARARIARLDAQRHPA